MTVSDDVEVARLKFRGGWGFALVPLGAFVATCVLYLAVFRVFDIYALAAGAFIGLLVGGLFAKGFGDYWASAIRGIGSRPSATIVAILLVVGMYAEVIKVSGLADGIVWLASSIGWGAGLFALFTFVATCIISMATGSSFGAMVTAFPVLFAAGVELGAAPVLLGGAVVSGAIFGDNLAPISDTTIISAAGQKYRRKEGFAEIGGVVASRSKYALLTAAVCAILYGVLGAGSDGGAPTQVSGDPMGLWMLIPVAVMLTVAIVARDLFAAITAGLIASVVVAIPTGLLTWGEFIGAADGQATGALIAGLAAMVPTVILVISVFALVAIVADGGILTRLTDALVRSPLARTPRGAEWTIAIGSSALTLAFGGINGAAMLTLSSVVDEVGSKVGLHPYRRSNIMDCFAMGISCVVPFLSAFLFIASSLTTASGYTLTTYELFSTAFYPLVLTVVMIVAIVTGWGRRFEGEDGRAVRHQADTVDTAVAV